MTKSLELLNCFTDDHPEWGVTELGEYLGLCKSAVHRFLSSFEKAGFLERTSRHRYRLGIRCLELGMMFQINDRLIRASERGLRILAEETGSIAHLSRLDGRETVELLRFCTMRRLIHTPKVSTRREAHATAKGKVFLAYSGEEHLLKYLGPRQFLKMYTSLTIDSPDRLRLGAAPYPAPGLCARRSGILHGHALPRRARLLDAPPARGGPQHLELRRSGADGQAAPTRDEAAPARRRDCHQSASLLVAQTAASEDAFLPLSASSARISDWVPLRAPPHAITA